MLNAGSLPVLFGGIMKKRILISVAAVIALVSIVGIISVSSLAAAFNRENFYLTDEELFEKASRAQNTVYLAYDNGGELVEVFNTSAIIGREWISIEDVGENILNAFISAEDREFYRHNGINVKRTAGALVNYLFHTSPRFGGSTITQQVIKNISGNNESTVKRKFNEILRALHIERIHSKEEILEVYLNIVPMSRNITGVFSAAEVYFGKKPSDLSIAEAATIAGITNSPGRYDPYTHPEECKEKRNRVLYAMHDNGKITDEEYENACACDLQVKKDDGRKSIYSWFVETANADIARDLSRARGITESAARVLMRGCKIILTEMPEVQAILDGFFADEDNLPLGCKDGQSIAMTVIDNATGNLVGIIGGVGNKSGNNLLNHAEITVPPASTIKPLAIYAPMLEEGLINWSTVVDDTPVSVEYKGDRVVTYPLNSPNVYAGLTTVRDAVRLSKNTIAVKLLNDYGINRCADGLIDRYGFNIIKEPTQIGGKSVSDLGVASLALGQLSAGVSLRKLTEAYSAFAREGKYSYSRSYLGVFDFEGNLLISPEATERRIYRAETCRIMNQMLMNVVETGTARSVTLKNILDTAGKTGTSSGNYDRLFVGYTPYFTAGVWTGYPDRSRAVEGGGPTHLEIWDKVMSEVHEKCALTRFGENEKCFSTQGLTRMSYCLDSGYRVGAECAHDLRGPRIAEGWFDAKNQPRDFCTLHRLIDSTDYPISAPDIKRDAGPVFVVDEMFSYSNLCPSEENDNTMADDEEESKSGDNPDIGPADEIIEEMIE